MNKYLFFLGIILMIFGNAGCNNSNPKTKSTQSENDRPGEEKNSESASTDNGMRKTPEEFVPEGYVVFEKIYGDLDKDGFNDCILIIKSTDKKNIVKDESRGELDRNRRGIIVLLKKSESYVMTVKNVECFSSENEEGGVYYPPELSVEISKCKLFVSYSHGRYGFWKYTFRLQDSDFELIGYDNSDNSGPDVNSETSINYLTKKKIVKTNTYEIDDNDNEIFEETVETIKIKKLIKLSEIEDFDELNVSEE